MNTGRLLYIICLLTISVVGGNLKAQTIVNLRLPKADAFESYQQSYPFLLIISDIYTFIKYCDLIKKRFIVGKMIK